MKKQVSNIVRRIVQTARPERIILFGSAARDATGPNSDLDFLVIKAGRFHRGRLADAIYESLRGVDAAVDIVIVTPEEVCRYGDDPCLVIAPALRHGKVVYGS